MTNPKRLVAVVDYGMGNLRVAGDAACAADSGFDVVVTSRAEDVMAAGIVLPGQGAPWPTCIRSCAEVRLPMCCMLQQHKPVWGVVGMQMLLTHSAEGVPGDGGAGTPAEPDSG
jgi:glutamine amidotransferase